MPRAAQALVIYALSVASTGTLARVNASIKRPRAAIGEAWYKTTV